LPYGSGNGFGDAAGPGSADLNGDGVVDGADLGLLLSGWTGTLDYPRDCAAEESSSMGGGSESQEAQEATGLSLAALAQFLGLETPQQCVEWMAAQPFEEMLVWLDILAD
jgi:hypothetical protein